MNELSEGIGKSSRNSSRAPSSDSTAQRGKRHKKPMSHRRQGAQPGHTRHDRPRVCEGDVDEIQRYSSDAVFGCSGTVAISHAQAMGTEVLADPYRQISNYVRSQPVPHAYETRYFRSTELRWLWSLVTLKASYFLVHHSRGKMAADTLLGEFQGFLVTDDFGCSNPVREERGQLCWSHLIRKFIGISQRVGSGGKIGRGLLLISRAVIQTRYSWQEGKIKEVVYFRRMNLLRHSFQRTLKRDARLQIDGQTKRQCIHLLTRESMCCIFLQDSRMPLANNIAERDLRSYVIWRKLSYASQSHQSADPEHHRYRSQDRHFKLSLYSRCLRGTPDDWHGEYTMRV